MIISVPHGGLIKWDEITPDRMDGCPDEDGGCIWEKNETCANATLCRAVVVSDLNTQDIADHLVAAYKNLTGKQPYVVKTLLYRYMGSKSKCSGYVKIYLSKFRLD